MCKVSSALLLALCLSSPAVVQAAATWGEITYVQTTLKVEAEDGFNSRVFRLRNNCGAPVSYKITSGAYPTPIAACTSDATCPGGFRCNTANGLCYWAVPVPASKSYTLAPGASDTLSFPIVDGNGVPDASWSGNIGFCTGDQCSDSAASCASGGCSSSGPVTLAEFTLNRKAPDYYDVSVIHGYSVAVSMGARFEDSSKVPKYWSPWWCGDAGAVTPTTPNGACSWKFEPPSNAYVWVKPGGNQCATDADCSGTPGAVCGVSDTPGTEKRIDRTCGAQLGYWSANQMCGLLCYGDLYCKTLRTGATDWVGCQTASPLASAYALIACGGPAAYTLSCYSQGAASSCCGCANWDVDGVPGVVKTGTNYTESCVSSNPAWHTLSKPSLLFLKKACPSAYTYPYDDITSTFTCNVPLTSGSASQNAAVYYIEMCPSSVSHLPSQDSGSGSGSEELGSGSSRAAAGAMTLLLLLLLL